MYTSIEEVFASYEENFDPSKASGLNGIFVLILSGEEGGEYTIRIEENTLSIEEGIYGSPDVRVQTTTRRWLAINNGEANPMMLMMQGKLKVRGSMAKATKLTALIG